MTSESVINTLVREIKEIERKIEADKFNLDRAQRQVTDYTKTIDQHRAELAEHQAMLTELGGKMPKRVKTVSETLYPNPHPYTHTHDTGCRCYPKPWTTDNAPSQP